MLAYFQIETLGNFQPLLVLVHVPWLLVAEPFLFPPRTTDFSIQPCNGKISSKLEIVETREVLNTTDEKSQAQAGPTGTKLVTFVKTFTFPSLGSSLTTFSGNEPQ